MKSIPLLFLACIPLCWGSDFPFITNVAFQPSTWSPGCCSGATDVKMTLTVESTSPPAFITLSVLKPDGGSFSGGGHGLTLPQQSNGIYTIVETVAHGLTQYTPAGTWVVRGLFVENQGGLKSAVMADQTFAISGTTSSGPPSFVSVVSTGQTVQANGNTVLQARVTMSSEAPITFLSYSYDGPSGNIEGGGSGITAASAGQNVWTYDWSRTVDACARSGTYTYAVTSLQNAALIEASTGAASVSWTVNNQVTGSAPVVNSVWVNPSVISEGGSATLYINASSPKCRVAWLDLALEYDGVTPPKNVIGGGGGVTPDTTSGFNIITYPHTFTRWNPSGNWTFRSLRIRNTAELSVNVPSVTFRVNNSFVARIPVILKSELHVRDLAQRANGTRFNTSTSTPDIDVNTPANTRFVVQLYLVIDSNAPLSFFTGRFVLPNGGTVPLEDSYAFNKVTDDWWEVRLTYYIPDAVLSDAGRARAPSLASRMWSSLAAYSSRGSDGDTHGRHAWNTLGTSCFQASGIGVENQGFLTSSQVSKEACVDGLGGSSSSSVTTIAGGAAGGFVVVAAVVGFVMWRKRQGAKTAERVQSSTSMKQFITYDDNTQTNPDERI